MANENLKKLVRGEPHWDTKVNENMDILSATDIAILTAIGQLSGLSTNDKSSLVKSINEIKAKLDMINVIEDTETNKKYRVTKKIVNGKPQIQYEEV